jgi:hypothetical protein
MIRIPTTIELAGLTVTTVFDNTLFKQRRMLGEARYLQQEIALDNEAPAEWDTKVQAYYHEKVHFILFLMGRDDLCNNEDFVDHFSHLLYQSDKTAKYVVDLTTIDSPIIGG